MAVTLRSQSVSAPMSTTPSVAPATRSRMRNFTRWTKRAIEATTASGMPIATSDHRFWRSVAERIMNSGSVPAHTSQCKSKGERVV